MVDKTTPNIMKLLWSYLAIVLVTNVMYIGYLFGQYESNQFSVSEDNLYSNFITSGEISSMFSLISTLGGAYSKDDVTEQGTQDLNVLQKEDKSIDFIGAITAFLKFLTLGSIPTSLVISEMVGGWLGFIISLYIGLLNIIFVYLLIKEVMNRFRLGG